MTSYEYELDCAVLHLLLQAMETRCMTKITAKECGKSSKLYVTCFTLGVGQVKCGLFVKLVRAIVPFQTPLYLMYVKNHP